MRTENPATAVSSAGTSPGLHRTSPRGGRKATREPAASSSPFPAYEDESQEQVHPRVGVRVFHESFGSGRIVALDGVGEKARAIVDFGPTGRKHLLLKYAQLKIEPA